jgi:hypothetical protein
MVSVAKTVVFVVKRTISVRETVVSEALTRDSVAETLVCFTKPIHFQPKYLTSVSETVCSGVESVNYVVNEPPAHECVQYTPR